MIVFVAAERSEAATLILPVLVTPVPLYILRLTSETSVSDTPNFHGVKLSIEFPAFGVCFNMEFDYTR